MPKGHEFTVYTSGGLSLDSNRLIGTQSATTSTGGSLVPTSVPANLGSTVALAVSSTPSGADIELDGSFVGSTPSSISVSLGDHNIAIRKVGYQAWQRTIRVSGGTVNVNAKLDH